MSNLSARLNRVEAQIPPPPPMPTQSALADAIDDMAMRRAVMAENLFGYDQTPDATTLADAMWHTSPALMLALARVHRAHSESNDQAIAERIEERAKVLAGELGDWLDLSVICLPGNAVGDWRARLEWAREHGRPYADAQARAQGHIEWSR